MSAQNVVTTLNNVTGMLQLALVVEGQLAPIVIGTVKDIKAWLNESGDITFTAALAAGNDELAAGLQGFKDSLAAINAQLVAAGKEAIPDPSATPAG